MKTLVQALILAMTPLLLSSCGAGTVSEVRIGRVAEAGLRITVVDSLNYAIEGVQVRVLEAWQEWDSAVYETNSIHALQLSDRFGETYFDAVDLAAAGLGFLEYPEGRAVISDHPAEDQVQLKVLVGAPGLGWIQAEIDLSYGDPFADLIFEF